MNSSESPPSQCFASLRTRTGMMAADHNNFQSLLDALGAPEGTNLQTFEGGDREAIARAARNWIPNWDDVRRQFLAHNYGFNSMHMHLAVVPKIIFSIETDPVPQCIARALLAMQDGAISVPDILNKVVCKNRKTRKSVVDMFLEHIPFSEHPKHTSSNYYPLWYDEALTGAIKHNCVGAVESIVKHYPTVLDMTHPATGMGPLHLVFGYEVDASERSKMLKVILKIGKEHGMKTVSTAVLTSCTRPRSTHGTRRGGTGTGGRNAPSTPMDLALYYLYKKYRLGLDCCDEWKCLSLCIKAANEAYSSFHFIHFVLSWELTVHDFLTEIIRHFELDVDYTDGLGRTPLVASILEDQQKSTYTEQLLKAHSRNSLARRIKSYADKDGLLVRNRYLLHIVLASKVCSWSITRTILHAGPKILRVRDPATGLLPFMQAAYNPDQSLSTLYQLLLEDPTALTSCDISGHGESMARGQWRWRWPRKNCIAWYAHFIMTPTHEHVGNSVFFWAAFLPILLVMGAAYWNR